MARAGKGDGRTRAWLDTVRRLLAFTGLYFVVYLPALPLLPDGGASRAGLLAASVWALVASLVAGIVMIRGHGRRAGALGIAWSRETAGQVIRGFLLGAAAIAVAAALLVAAGTLTYGREAGGIGDWVRVVVGDFGFLAVAAMAEEATFRGYPFQLIARQFGPVAAMIVTSAGFALAHAANPNVSGFALVNIFLAGILLALAYLRTRSLWFAAAVHVGWNWTVAVAADLPVSGLDLLDTPLYEPVVRGPHWLTGGAFGPEGGMAVTVAAILAIVALARWQRVAETDAMRSLRPLVDRDETGERVVNA